MWSAHATGWMAREYVVADKGSSVAELRFGTWSERGAIELDGKHLEIVREGFWNPKFHLRHGGKRVATGYFSGALRRGFYLAHGNEEYRLDPNSWFGRNYNLTLRGRPLGQIRSLGLLARRFQVDLDRALAPELRLFAFWLVLLAHRRAAAAAVPAVS